MIARILTIAGSDSGGGAGIEADLKTITALGGYGCTCITGLTAQNTIGVLGVHPVPAAFVGLCMRAVISDIGVDAVKLGMLTNAEIIHQVAADLPPMAPLVLDPVMISTSGSALLPDEAVDVLVKKLLPRATLVTPNLPEAARLTGLPLETPAQCLTAGHRLMAMGAQAVLIKGGHAQGAMLTDYLIMRDQLVTITLPRLKSQNTHGTGCTLSAAIATGLGQGLVLETAVRRARAYLQTAIASAPGFGAGHGPVNHLVAPPPHE